MPIANFDLPKRTIDGLDDLKWRLRCESRVALVRYWLAILVPNFDAITLAQFICKHFPDKVDDLTAEIARLEEKQLDVSV